MLKTTLLRLLIAYEFRWPSFRYTAIRIMDTGSSGDAKLKLLLVELMHEYTVTVATAVLFVTYK
jgi:hypothetical protein